ncbi:MAG: hybrid sensor histidine kinase/response regulator [Rhodospirillales bacterium]|nr:hybrid sensor histidine kinase/response regulator [Rhodospirillales bacterium]
MTNSVGLPPDLDALTILESTTDCVCVIDRDWRIAYMSRRASVETARGREFVGLVLWEALPEIGASAFGRAYRQAMAEGVPTEAEEFYPPLDAWFSANAYPLPDGIMVFFRNINARKQSEAALRASEERFRELFRTLNQGIVFHDRHGNIIDANPAAGHILGLSLDELRSSRHSGDRRWRAVDGEGRELPPAKHPSVMALSTGRTQHDCVLGIFNPLLDERRWLLVDAIPQFRLGEATPYQVYTLFSDRTDQRRAEIALRESEAHLSRAQRVAAIGSGEIDFSNGSWKWSDETYRIYGLDKATFVISAESIAAMVHVEDREYFGASVEAARRGITPPTIEYRIARPDGQIRTVARECELTRDESGAVIGVIATTRDVTELRAAQRQREELQEQLLHAQRLDALGTLAGGIAHDLNNTLVPIIALACLGRDATRAGEPLHADLLTILQAGLRAQELVQKILAFSRKETAEPALFALASVLREALGMLRAGVPSSICIDESLADIPPIHGDPGQIHQVIVNLITNSAQAIGPRPGTITVTLDLAAIGAAPAAQLAITDTGCGMDEATLSRALEPFFTTKGVGEGTGLGLSVVHGIVASHHGTMQIQSRTGQGTSVTIRLPLAPPGPEPAAAVERKSNE